MAKHKYSKAWVSYIIHLKTWGKSIPIPTEKYEKKYGKT